MWATAKYFDITDAVSCFRYYAGWADKVHGKTIEVGTRIWIQDNLLTVHENKSRHEPYGVVVCFLSLCIVLLLISLF